MKPNILLITLLLSSFYALAQHHPPGLLDFRNKLRNECVDTVLAYSIACAGGLSAPPADKKCHPYFIEYLVWQKNGQSFTRRFDECKQYKPRHINPLFMRIVINNYNAIKKEDIVNPEFERYDYGIFYTTYQVAMVHTCYTRFRIYTGGKRPLEKEINWYYLDARVDRENNKNLNYYKNQHTILNKLKMLAEKEIKGKGF